MVFVRGKGSISMQMVIVMRGILGRIKNMDLVEYVIRKKGSIMVRVLVM
jgi:hypothetical protein